MPFPIRLGGKLHLVCAVVAVDFHGKPSGKRVHDGCADSVESAGILVGSVLEFTAGMQLRKNNFNAGYFHLLVYADRDTPAVVRYRNGVVAVNGNGHLARVPVGGLVDRIVHDLPQKMVQTALPGRADIHAGTHSDRVQTFHYLDIFNRINLRIFHHMCAVPSVRFSE